MTMTVLRWQTPDTTDFYLNSVADTGEGRYEIRSPMNVGFKGRQRWEAFFRHAELDGIRYCGTADDEDAAKELAQQDYDLLHQLST